MKRRTTSPAQSVTLTNLGSVALIISGISIKGADPGSPNLGLPEDRKPNFAARVCGPHFPVLENGPVIFAIGRISAAADIFSNSGWPSPMGPMRW